MVKTEPAVRAGLERRLYRCVHWTQPFEQGDTMEDILAPVREAVEEGLIKHVGLSNCTLEDIQAATAALPEGCLATVQNKYHLYYYSIRRGVAHLYRRTLEISSHFDICLTYISISA